MKHILMFLDSSEYLLLDTEEKQIHKISTRQVFFGDDSYRISGVKDRTYRISVVRNLVFDELQIVNDDLQMVVLYFEKIVLFKINHAPDVMLNLIRRLLSNERRPKILEALKFNNIESNQVFLSFIQLQLNLFSQEARPYSHLLDVLYNVLQSSADDAIAASCSWAGDDQLVHYGLPFPRVSENV